MTKSGQNEEKIRQDFESALGELKNLLTELNQFLEKIRTIIQMRIQEESEAGSKKAATLSELLSKTSSEEKNPSERKKLRESLAKGLDQLTQNLNNNNQKLTHNLTTLREVKGKLSSDTQNTLRNQAQALDDSIEETIDLNKTMKQELSQAELHTTFLNGALNEQNKEKAVEVKDTLNETLKKTAEQVYQLKTTLSEAKPSAAQETKQFKPH